MDMDMAGGKEWTGVVEKNDGWTKEKAYFNKSVDNKIR